MAPKQRKAPVIVKPRNPVIGVLMAKRGGAHRKSEQALRKQAKDALRKSLKADET